MDDEATVTRLVQDPSFDLNEAIASCRRVMAMAVQAIDTLDAQIQAAWAQTRNSGTDHMALAVSIDQAIQQRGRRIELYASLHRRLQILIHCQQQREAMMEVDDDMPLEQQFARL